MSKSQPFVGDHAEYYRRQILRESVNPNELVRENRYLRKRISELEQEIEEYEEQIEAFLYSQRGILQRILDWFFVH